MMERSTLARRTADPPSRRGRARRAFSLLEVMLSLAILAGALTAIGFLTDIGLEHSRTASALSQAQLLCEARMAEISAGVMAVEPVFQASLAPAVTTEGEEQGLNELSDWVYTVELAAIDGPAGLISVKVTVQQDPGQFRRPVGYALVRWIPDPGVVLAEAEADAAAAAEATGSTTSGAASGTSTGAGSSGSSTGSASGT